jgi:flagellar FliL protein
MSDQAVSEDGGDEVEVEARPKGGMNGKKLILFIVLPILLLLIAGAGIYFSGLADSLLGKGDGEHAEEEFVEEIPIGPAIFYDLPEMLINLTSGGRRANFLKISVSLELQSEADLPQIEAVLPRIRDNFQVYLRELRIEDLQGSAGLQRLREELLLRVNAAARPAVIQDVLFKEMLVQ